MAGAADKSPGVVAGYLPKAALPDSVALLPPPPAVGSRLQIRSGRDGSDAMAVALSGVQVHS
jgi:hypothetical protein